jgi:CheY-specific phosphatase CheX
MCSMKLPEAGAPIGGGYDAVLSAITDVAERSFFAMVDAVDAARFAGSGADISGWLAAAVTFDDGGCRGTVVCHLPSSLADRLFDAFSGRDVDDPPPLVAEVHDLVGEFANMVCGSWLTRGANDRTFSLGTPEVTVSAALTADPASGLRVELDGSPVLIDIGFERVTDAALA